MPPGEEDEEELVYYVAVGDVEVVLEGGIVEVAVDLSRGGSAVRHQDIWARRLCYAPGLEVTHVLLEIFLAVLEGSLAELGGELGGGVVHEVAVLAEVAAVGRPLLSLVGVAIVLRLGLGACRWRRRW